MTGEMTPEKEPSRAELLVIALAGSVLTPGLSTTPGTHTGPPVKMPSNKNPTA